MNDKSKIIIIQNIISPYTVTLFNELNRKSKNKIIVVYLAETMLNRDWNIDYDRIDYSYHLLNKGPLENVNMMKLSLQLLKFLLMKKNQSSIYIIGEYSNLAYWACWLYGIVKRRLIGARLEMFSEAHAKPTNCVKEFVKKIFFSQCDFVLAAGEKHVNYAISLGMKPEQVYNIHGVGGVDKKVYRSCLNEIHINRKNAKEYLNITTKRNFIYVGRLAPEKNIEFMLDAFKEFKKSNKSSDWGLIILGDGPLREHINHVIKEYNIKDVYMFGFVQQKDIAPYFCSADVLILPSIIEPWGLVVDEALAFSLAVVISSKCGCTPDIVKNNYNGLIIDPTDIKTLISAFYECTNYELLDIVWKKNSQVISEKYTVTNSAEIIWNAICDVTA